MQSPQADPVEPASEPFCKLAGVDAYVACDWNLVKDWRAREHWWPFFVKHVDNLLAEGIASAVAAGENESHARLRAEQLKRDFVPQVERFGARPDDYHFVSIFTLDRWREMLMKRHGFADAFWTLKHRENERLLPMLPDVCAALDALDERAAFDLAVRQVFAGNIFDMGAEATAGKFAAGAGAFDFAHAVETLKPRPWLIDEFDTYARRVLDGPRHAKLVYFIDNAGSDFVLGAIPLIRFFARRGTRVVIAANEHAALNDVTAADVRRLWSRLLEALPDLAGLPVSVVSTGTGEPLIDLSRVSPALNAAAADADLVLLEGMGRGVETNLHAPLTCDRANLAILKDREIARRLTGEVFDIVCRFEPAG